ncbi:MAG: iduronate-2-sulfatase [Pirellulaceae bacterium]|nr:MAG: iduronate-2-sulfatase [Pirellulaceae bacterium]
MKQCPLWWRILCGVTAVGWLLLGSIGRLAAEGRYNVLLICVDDMRPQLGCYGDRLVHSPHIDRLAARGTVFLRSFVQQALCSPSRISMLTSRYPSTTGIYTIGPPLRSTLPDVVTVPQYFKLHGYDCRSFGKVYHVGIDDEASWTVPAWHSRKPRYGKQGQAAVEARREEYRRRGIQPPPRGRDNPFYAGPAFEAADLPDDELLDGDTVVHAIHQLQEYAQSPDQRFFLAVGFSNPHVPWVSPRKYWDLYDPGRIPLPVNTQPPRNAPPFAATSGQDFRYYGNVPPGPLDEAFQRACLHGYLAAISYVDALIGRLLAALEQTGLASNTVVVLWSDHGYYMGEHGWWGAKHNNYEGATRNVLIISYPGQTTQGTKSPSLVQSVDIGPTLVELCGLPTNADFEGRSLAPILKDPQAEVNDAAFSWYPKSGYLGVAMRTDRWRFVEWTKAGEEPVYELYDQLQDPENNENLAVRSEYRELLVQLSRQLRSRFPRQDIPQMP